MRNLIRATVTGSILVLIVAASAFADVARFGTLVLRGDGGVFPTKLPKHRQAPIGGYVSARLDTADGSHPPAIQRVIVDFDRAFQLNAPGLPVCKSGQLQARDTGDAKKACSKAIVGSGNAEVEVQFEDSAPFTAEGPLVLFNGGVKGGVTTLFIHAYVSVPAPTAIVIAVKITRVRQGRFGLHAVAEIPKIAGGAGSATAFRLRIKRTFNYKGKKRSYITASCPTGLFFARAKVQFTDGTTLMLGRALPCTAKG